MHEVILERVLSSMIGTDRRDWRLVDLRASVGGLGHGGELKGDYLDIVGRGQGA